MKTENKNSEKDLNGNPESRLNTRKPSAKKPGKFPESNLAKDEIAKSKREKVKDSDNKLPADEEDAAATERNSSSELTILPVSVISAGMRMARRN